MYNCHFFMYIFILTREDASNSKWRVLTAVCHFSDFIHDFNRYFQFLWTNFQNSTKWLLLQVLEWKGFIYLYQVLRKFYISSDPVQACYQITLFESACNGIQSTQGCTNSIRHGVARKGRKPYVSIHSATNVIICARFCLKQM